jgi:hypothetical protein
MGYKAAYVWNGANWSGLGAQIPNIPAAVPFAQVFGNDNVTLSSGEANRTVALPAQTFGAIPSIFVQVTGPAHATVAVTNVTLTDFTINIKGTGNSVIPFNWTAVQPRT